MAGKLILRCELVVRTGLHIGGSNAYSAIGAVDSPVIRDPKTGRPLLPGSSLKGKLRSLLAQSLCREGKPTLNDEPKELQELFGTANPPRCAKLQFADGFVLNAQEMKAVGLTEVKSENSIHRITAVANPRQLERVVPGVIFGMCMTYQFTGQQQAEQDMALLAKGMRLLQMDYLGGHGSRGSGRVSLRNFQWEGFEAQVNLEPLQALFHEVENYELLAF